MFLTAAGLLMIATGAAHSVIGERKIFMQLPEGARAPGTDVAENSPYRGILRATWHTTTLLGFVVAAVLLHHASQGTAMPLLLRAAVVMALTGSSAAVLWWTMGRHPGWLALAGAAGLTAVG